jgi:hypothetical protein
MFLPIASDQNSEVEGSGAKTFGSARDLTPTPDLPRAPQHGPPRRITVPQTPAMTTIETRSTRDSAAMLVEEAPERKRPRRSAESTPCSEGGPAASRRFAERELRTPYGYLDFSATVGSPERDGLSGLVPLNLNLGFEHVADEHRAVASPEARRERRFCLDGSAVVEDALVKVFDRLDMVELQLANSTCTHWRRLIDSNKELRPKLPTRVPMARNFIELYRIDKMLELAQSKSPALDVSNDKVAPRPPCAGAAAQKFVRGEFKSAARNAPRAPCRHPAPNPRPPGP